MKEARNNLWQVEELKARRTVRPSGNDLFINPETLAGRCGISAAKTTVTTFLMVAVLARGPHKTPTGQDDFLNSLFIIKLEWRRTAGAGRL